MQLMQPSNPNMTHLLIYICTITTVLLWEKPEELAIFEQQKPQEQQQQKQQPQAPSIQQPHGQSTNQNLPNQQTQIPNSSFNHRCKDRGGTLNSCSMPLSLQRIKLRMLLVTKICRDMAMHKSRWLELVDL
ncbi:uncharacterized protein [Rutidosis leptorrhynchoides]|uniref:uncharacterized protein n=1 Tax=Rutidosis leptorrhynchoides TaxID=125765 RepID=UPI003A98D5BB